ncbi:hypothetical protein EV644_11194 [Kribbella orskensis]|uniref:Ig-like domain-containing protein n=1 Tax=Kribbella orskensis TaxID=2512216 RepID=A0ABY2BGB5_9ACTN|nr:MULTISPECIES: hypothetical protein [Kribbella]TCN37642.1 hypothetical protein EV642_111171 [Kribbella sp. VKM Ac-2500]TCO18856.1 hypothetical protein EV644_11194 [Kribbella orskensis]
MIRRTLRAVGLIALSIGLVQVVLPGPAFVNAATEAASGSMATAADVGFVGPAYTGTTAPTGQKPQSKLWIADGIWWGSLWDTASRDFHIFWYDWAANSWTDTGVLVEDRPNSYLDALWDGSHLYIASAGATANNAGQSPRVTRFSYNTATKQWSRDVGYPVTLASGGVQAVVLAKDSTGLLWVTFVQNAKVWLTHSTAGDDLSWVAKYQLPTPGNEANVQTLDISSIIAYDGDKIGVLWSNQRTQIMYWAAHADGASDQSWTLQIAYQQSEGADDHINLKSLVGDPSGRVFAVAKTSMDAPSDPLINLLVLTPSGQWTSRPVYTKADDSTRAIVQIDTSSREVYVFAAAPCCTGGTIYYKKAGLDNPVFQPGLGTAFIHNAAHPEANNPTSTKQNLSGATGLLVLAGDDETRRYLYNRLTLGGAPPPDTDPPETTITSAPPAVTSSLDATFTFSSSEAGSTFACSLDGQPAAPCTSPTAYTGLGFGSHTFSVTATDAAGNGDPSPAAHAWLIQAETPAIFADDFSSGGFAAGGWTVHTGGGGTATVISGAVNPGDLGARLTSTTATGATASIRKALGTSYADLTVAFDAKVTAGGSTDTFFALAKIYNGAGTRQLSVLRVAATGELRVQFRETTVTTSGTLVDGRIARISVRLALGASDDTVVVSVDGAVIYSSSTADLGSVGFANLRMGDDSLRRNLDYRFDNVEVTE